LFPLICKWTLSPRWSTLTSEPHPIFDDLPRAPPWFSFCSGSFPPPRPDGLMLRPPTALSMWVWRLFTPTPQDFLLCSFVVLTSASFSRPQNLSAPARVLLMSPLVFLSHWDSVKKIHQCLASWLNCPGPLFLLIVAIDRELRKVFPLIFPSKFAPKTL